MIPNSYLVARHEWDEGYYDLVLGKSIRGGNDEEPAG
jgi:hypothetical protein